MSSTSATISDGHVSDSTTAASQDAAIARILDLSRAYKLSQALNLAGKLELFSKLATHSAGQTSTQLAQELGFCQAPGFRGSTDFFDLLVALGCLHRDGAGETALYHVAPEVLPFLVKGSEHYMGGILTLNHTRSYVQLEYLEDCLRDGQLPEAASKRLPDILETFAKCPSAARDFALGMLGASRVCRQHPHLTAVTYDLPAVHPVAEEYVLQSALQGRVKVMDLDFFSEAPFPSGHDVITMGMVLHDWGLEKKRRLIRKVHAALPPGGAFIAIENLIDDDRRQRHNALAMSLDMLCEFGRENAFDFSFKEFCGWVLEAGFRSTELMALSPTGTAYAAIAYA